MNEASANFFRALLDAPSPSGFEQPVQAVVREYAGSFTDEVTTDTHGNVVAIINPGLSRRIMLAGHCDQVGLLVHHIDKDGFLYVQPIGGCDVNMFIGRAVNIWTANGPVTGAISRKAIHLLSEDERKQVPKISDLWIDIGVHDDAAANALVRVGDPVTVDLGYRELTDGRVFGPGMDDKAGVWVVFEALRRASEKGPTCAISAVSTVQEEIGFRGAKTSAYTIDPQVGIVVDVTHDTSCPTSDKRQESDIALGRGPVIYRGANLNPKVVDLLIETAQNCEIPFQLAAISAPTPTDANAIQISRAGIATGLVSIPNRYMHSSVETVSLSDMEHAAGLVAEFCVRMTPDVDLTP